jgi:hypothetical protein
MRAKHVVSLCLIVTALGCGEADKPRQLPYDPDETTIIGGGDGTAAPAGDARTVNTPDGEDCVNLDITCVQPQDECGDDGTADVIVDNDGTVLYVACYPQDGVSVEEFEGPVEDLPNNAVLVIDGDVDGADVVGDVTIDGNNITVYGNGPDVSVIDGNLDIAMNNSIVRGVRITQDVTISKNNGTLIDCVIEGNLTITGENVNVALCEVWGETHVLANNAVFVANVFGSEPVIDANMKACNNNTLFSDDNDDGEVTPDELGAEIDCGVE